MKNWKRAAALLGVALLLVVFALPMFFAFGKGENAPGLFRASLGALILVPVMAYVFSMVYRLLNRKEKKVGETGIKNIIFDVGQVLVTYDWEGYLKTFDFPEEEYRLMAEKVFLSDTWVLRDKGELSEEEYVRLFVEALPQYEEDVVQVLKHSYKTISIKDYAETWTKYLKSQGYHLYILSNYCAYILEHTRPMMSFLKYTEGEIFSCEVNQLKPDEEIYQTLLTRWGLDPGECVFLDDREENCQAARRLGIQAIQFQDFRQAAGELEKLGVQ